VLISCERDLPFLFQYLLSREEIDVMTKRAGAATIAPGQEHGRKERLPQVLEASAMEKEIIFLIEEASEGGKGGRGKHRMSPDCEGGAESAAALPLAPKRLMSRIKI
jgi:hypothetical protein